MNVELNIEREIKEKLSNWKSLIAKYQIPSTRKAVIQMLTTFLPYLAIWILMYISYNLSLIHISEPTRPY